MSSRTRHQHELKQLLASCESRGKVSSPQKQIMPIRLKSCPFQETASNSTFSARPIHEEIYLTKYLPSVLSPNKKKVFSLEYITPKQLPSLQHKLKLKNEKQRKSKPHGAEKIAHSLYSRYKRHRTPANASSSSQCIFNDAKKKIPVQQSMIYSEIRSGRQNLEQMRKIIVLGKIINENFRKGVKQINHRKNRMK